MRKLLPIFFCLISVCACKSPKIVEQTVIRDSLVYVPETISVQMPYEVVKEVVPHWDTLKMETSIAEALAWVDTTTLFLKGELRNKEVEVPVIVNNKHFYHNRDIVKTIEKTITVTKTKKKVPKTLIFILLGLLGLIIGQNWKKVLKIVRFFL